MHFPVYVMRYMAGAALHKDSSEKYSIEPTLNAITVIRAVGRTLSTQNWWSADMHVHKSKNNTFTNISEDV